MSGKDGGKSSANESFGRCGLPSHDTDPRCLCNTCGRFCNSGAIPKVYVVFYTKFPQPKCTGNFFASLRRSPPLVTEICICKSRSTTIQTCCQSCATGRCLNDKEDKLFIAHKARGGKGLPSMQYSSRCRGLRSNSWLWNRLRRLLCSSWRAVATSHGLATLLPVTIPSTWAWTLPKSPATKRIPQAPSRGLLRLQLTQSLAPLPRLESSVC